MGGRCQEDQGALLTAQEKGKNVHLFTCMYSMIFIPSSPNQDVYFLSLPPPLKITIIISIYPVSSAIQYMCLTQKIVLCVYVAVYANSHVGALILLDCLTIVCV